MSLTWRSLPARPSKIKLRGGEMTGAPITALFSQLTGSSLQPVEGIVDLVPTEGASYTVKGELKATGSSIWIEDDATHQPVTAKIIAE